MIINATLTHLIKPGESLPTGDRGPSRTVPASVRGALNAPTLTERETLGARVRDASGVLRALLPDLARGLPAGEAVETGDRLELFSPATGTRKRRVVSVETHDKPGGLSHLAIYLADLG